MIDKGLGLRQLGGRASAGRVKVPTVVVPVQSVSIIGEADQLPGVLRSEPKTLPYVEDRLLIARKRRCDEAEQEGRKRSRSTNWRI